MPDIDRSAAARALLSDRLLTELLDEFEQSYIDRFKFADEDDDRKRQNMATALLVITDFRETLRNLAAQGESVEQVSENGRWV